MLSKPLKIIWNITNKCGYECEICATRSDRDELDFGGKNQVLKSVLSLGIQNISEIDFAGGDPLYVEDAIHIVEDAIKILGKQKISVTTTGKGIVSAFNMNKNLSQLLYNCEVTIDYLEDISDYIRNDFSYAANNQAAIKNFNKYIGNLIINIPILNPKMSDECIQKLVDMIAGIDVKNVSVNLIRLMNVGLLASNSNSDLYSPEHFVKSFIKFANSTCIKNVNIHCALRGKILDSQCNMLCDKVGIDCSGNVFACAWGGYIDGYNKFNICKNPFYLGNLLEKSLTKVLEDERASQLEQLVKKNPTNHCRVYCFKNNDVNSIFKDTDPLFNCNN